MLDFPPLMPLVRKPGLYQASRVLGDGLYVAVESFGDCFQCYSFPFVQQKQDLKPPVICRSLKIPL